jgi:hypothetical protein
MKPPAGVYLPEEQPLMTVGDVTLKRMKTNTNEFAQHIGSPRRGV